MTRWVRALDQWPITFWLSCVMLGMLVPMAMRDIFFLIPAVVVGVIVLPFAWEGDTNRETQP